MKWINADQQVTVNIYDDEHEEYFDKIMTVEEMLDAYTADGCPTIYANPEPKTGHWIRLDYWLDRYKVQCSECARIFVMGIEIISKHCPNCGCRMVEPQESEDKE